jgi:hypothetical protein
VIKYLTKWGHYPPFIYGLLSSLNYAASFGGNASGGGSPHPPP